MDPLDYNEWLRQHNLNSKTPKFDRHPCNFSLSVEAYYGLLMLSKTFGSNVETNANRKITSMLEALGLGQITINTPVELELNGITTMECYEAGRQDALEKRPPDFKLIFGDLPREFHEAYRRGYLEVKSDRN